MVVKQGLAEGSAHTDLSNGLPPNIAHKTSTQYPFPYKKLRLAARVEGCPVRLEGVHSRILSEDGVE